MDLLGWAVQHHNTAEVLTERQQKLLDSCLEGILGMDKNVVEQIYAKDKETNFSGDEQVTAQHPSIEIHPTGISTGITINGVDATDINLW